jgi:hypothetical protein
MNDDYLDTDTHNSPSGEPPYSSDALAKLIDQFGSPYGLYRAIYKASVGHTIGIEIDGSMVYCDDLPGDYDPQCHTYSAVSVSSIVEGSDYTSEGDVLRVRPDGSDFTEKEFWALVESVAEDVAVHWELANSQFFKFDGEYFQWIDGEGMPRGCTDLDTKHRSAVGDFIYGAIIGETGTVDGKAIEVIEPPLTY